MPFGAQGICRSCAAERACILQRCATASRPCPTFPPAVRTEARSLLAELGPAGLHARLAAEDPLTASKLRPSDSQRITRAWEVWRATGVGLADWQAQPTKSAPGLRLVGVLLDPPRPALRDAIAARFRAMLEAGAVEEVRQLVAAGLPPSLPAMRAHGVPELSAYLRGEITLPAAEMRAVAATGRYTKRQATWFRHHALADRACTIHARWATLRNFLAPFALIWSDLFRTPVDAPHNRP